MKRLLIILALFGCGPDPWYAEHQQRCKAWALRARTDSDRLNVEMTCASMVQSYDAMKAAKDAEMASWANYGASMSRK